MVGVGLLKQANRALVLRAETPVDALAALASAESSYVEKWITEADR